MPRRLLLLLLPMLIAACGREKGLVLARVDSAPVTAEEFARELAGAPAGNSYLRTPAGKKELLELLIRRRMVLAEAERSPAAKKPATRAKLEELDAEFLRQKREARERFLVGEFLRYLREGPLKVTDDEVKTAWSSEKEARASHILVSDEAVAKSLRARLDKGEPFESLAKSYSEDPTGKNGGDLGYLMRGSLDLAFENALFGLKIGEVAGPVASPYGYHLIKKTGERPLSNRPLAEMEKSLRVLLENQKFQAWLVNARKRHAISIDTAALDKTGMASRSTTTN